MLALLQEFNVYPWSIRKLKIAETDQIMAFERGNLWFFFNFNPTRSFTNYGIEVMPGKYELLLNTDEKRFGGFDRLHPRQSYFTTPEQDGNILKHELKLYLPSRSALVLTKVD